MKSDFPAGSKKCKNEIFIFIIFQFLTKFRATKSMTKHYGFPDFPQYQLVSKQGEFIMPSFYGELQSDCTRKTIPIFTLFCTQPVITKKQLKRVFFCFEPVKQRNVSCWSVIQIMCFKQLFRNKEIKNSTDNFSDNFTDNFT